MAGATIVQQPTNNDLKQLFQDLNKAKELSNEEAVRTDLYDSVGSAENFST